MSRGWPASSENIIPIAAVDTISSVTPIMPSVFSPAGGQTKNDIPSELLARVPRVSVCRIGGQNFTQQAAEGDGGWQRSEVDEDDAGQALHVQGVFQVAHVLRVAAPDVMDQASERYPRAHQRVHFLVACLLLLCGHLYRASQRSLVNKVFFCFFLSQVW